jgi:PDZ domain
MYEFAVTPVVTQLRRQGVTITEVLPESLAEELDLQVNDRIVRVNGRPVRDYLDFRFQTAGETELISVCRLNKLSRDNVRTNVCFAFAKAIPKTRDLRFLSATKIFGCRFYTEITRL